MYNFVHKLIQQIILLSFTAFQMHKMGTKHQEVSTVLCTKFDIVHIQLKNIKIKNP